VSSKLFSLSLRKGVSLETINPLLEDIKILRAFATNSCGSIRCNSSWKAMPLLVTIVWAAFQASCWIPLSRKVLQAKQRSGSGRRWPRSIRHNCLGSSPVNPKASYLIPSPRTALIAKQKVRVRTQMSLSIIILLASTGNQEVKNRGAVLPYKPHLPPFQMDI